MRVRLLEDHLRGEFVYGSLRATLGLGVSVEGQGQRRGLGGQRRDPSREGGRMHSRTRRMHSRTGRMRRGLGSLREKVRLASGS